MVATKRTSAEVIEYAKENDIKMVDLMFTDLPGTLQHVTLPIAFLDEDLFADGTGFDGSSIRGFQSIEESDMLLVPDPNTAVIDPILEVPTLSMLCNIRDPITGENYSRDPAQHRAEGGEVPGGLGARGRELLGPGAGVLHLRLGAVRAERAERVLLRGLGRGDLELGQRVHAYGRPEPGLPAGVQGRVFPGVSGGHADRHKVGGDAEDAGVRHRRREAPPRGGDGGAGGDRLRLRHAD